MLNLGSGSMVVSRLVGRGILLTRKASPTLLLILGLGGMVVGTIMACKATLKVEELALDPAQIDLEKIAHAHVTNTLKGDPNYTEKDYQKDKIIVKVKAAKALVKLYGPSALVMIASGAAIIGGHHILNVRNAGLVAGLKIVDAAFKKYRDRVVLSEGEAKDQEYRYGIVQKQITETVTDEEGKQKKEKKTVNFSEELDGSMYSRYFQPGNPNWGNNLTDNLYFLKLAQNHANDLLNSRGHVFLNEAYESVGLPHTDFGALVGWVRDSDVGDKKIEFGLTEIISDLSAGLKYVPRILLDFNVDGVIWKLI